MILFGYMDITNIIFYFVLLLLLISLYNLIGFFQSEKDSELRVRKKRKAVQFGVAGIILFVLFSFLMSTLVYSSVRVCPSPAGDVIVRTSASFDGGDSYTLNGKTTSCGGGWAMPEPGCRPPFYASQCRDISGIRKVFAFFGF